MGTQRERFHGAEECGHAAHPGVPPPEPAAASTGYPPTHTLSHMKCCLDPSTKDEHQNSQSYPSEGENKQSITSSEFYPKGEYFPRLRKLGLCPTQPGAPKPTADGER